MALELYTNASVTVEGALLAEEVSLSIDRETRAQEVLTVHKGFAGLSPGAKILTATIDNAVPSSDFELDPSTYMDELRVVEVTFYVAGKSLTSKGFIIGDTFGHAVNTESKLNFKFVGEFAKWK